MQRPNKAKRCPCTGHAIFRYAVAVCFAEVRRTLDDFGFTAHIRSRGEEAQTIKKEAGFKAQRWVVERTHSWLNRFRRILIRWDKSPANYIAFLHCACALRAVGLLG